MVRLGHIHHSQAEFPEVEVHDGFWRNFEETTLSEQCLLSFEVLDLVHAEIVLRGINLQLRVREIPLLLEGRVADRFLEVHAHINALAVSELKPVR